MENEELIKTVTDKAMVWLGDAYDEDIRQDVKRMLDSDDKTDLIDSFYRDLEFGTGGLRGIMGAGSNRMNKYTVGAATQGLANYLKVAFKDLPEISVVVGHDVRNNSRKFAEIVADIFSANGIKVYLFDDFRPTPELSFAIAFPSVVECCSPQGPNMPVSTEVITSRFLFSTSPSCAIWRLISSIEGSLLRYFPPDCSPETLYENRAITVTFASRADAKIFSRQVKSACDMSPSAPPAFDEYRSKPKRKCRTPYDCE